MLSDEGFYLSCMLELGIPKILRFNEQGEPVSTTMWLGKVHMWWEKHHPDYDKTDTDSYGTFCHWWIKYKRWIVEQSK